MPKRREAVPPFASQADERDFWERTDSADFIDWGKAERVRLPLSLLERIKVAAHKRDVPYQSLIKIWLAEKLEIPE